jgi:hypothetical protein
MTPPVALNGGSISKTGSVVVNTTAPVNLSQSHLNSLGGLGKGAALAFLFLFGISSRRRKVQSLLSALVLVVLLAGLTGCGGAVSAKTGSGLVTGTTAGVYTITVTGSANDPAKSTATTTFVLTVN